MVCLWFSAVVLASLATVIVQFVLETRTVKRRALQYLVIPQN